MAEVRFNIVVDEKGAVKKIDAVGTAFDKSAKTSDQATKSHQAAGTSLVALRGAYIAAAAAVTGIVVAGSKAIASHDAQVQAINSLNLALANQGNLLPGVSQRLQEFASTLQSMTTFGDEVILQNTALLASFGANEEQLRRAIPAALDFATATGRDLTSAVNLLGKAFAGETGELSRYGIIIDKSIPKTERFSAVVDIMTSRFGGAAQAQVATFGGQITQVTNAFDDALEQVGKFIKFLTVDFAGGLEQSKSAFQAIGDFFGKTLPLALTEFDARMLEAQASVKDFFASIVEGAQGIPGLKNLAGAILPDPAAIRAAAQSQRELAAETREMGNQFALAEPGVLTFKNTVGGPGGVAPVVDELTKKIASLKETLSGAGIQAEANAATRAIQELGGAGNLSVTGLESLSGTIENLRKNSEMLSPELAAVALELDKIALRRDLAGVIDDLKAAELTTEDWKAALEGIPPELDNIDAGIAAAMGPNGQAIVGGIEKRTISWGDAMSGVNDFLSETRGLMTLMGVEADSTFGKIINGISKVFDAFNSLTGIIDKVLGAFGKGGGLGGLFGGLFGGGGGGGGGLGSILGGLGGLFGGGGGVPGIGAQTAALGFPAAGEAAGAGFLSGFGGLLSSGLGALGKAAGALFTNPFGLAILGGIGAFFGLKKLFGFFGGESGIEQQSRIVGEFYGAKISESLADTIAKQGKAEGRSVAGLFLEQIFQEGGQSADDLARSMQSVFHDTNLTAQEQAASIASVVDDLLANFGSLGSEGTASVEQLIRDVASTGRTFEGLNPLVEALAGSLISSAQAGGDAWLSAVNAIGTTGRESLEFLINEFGSALPESARAAIEEILGLGAALGDDVAAGANSASADVTGLTGDVEVLGAEQPGTLVGNDIAIGIGAGVKAAILDVEMLRKALEELGNTGVNPPNLPNVPEGAAVSAQGGFFSSAPLRHDQLFQAHAGELAFIGKPHQFQSRAPQSSAGGGRPIYQIAVNFNGPTMRGNQELENFVVNSVKKGIRATSNRGGLRSEMRQNVR